MSFLLLIVLAAAVRFAVDRRAVDDPRIGTLAPPPRGRVGAVGSTGDDIGFAFASRVPRIIALQCWDMSAVVSAAMKDWLLRTVQDPATHEISVHVARRRDRGDATEQELRADRQARLYLPARPLVLTDGTIVRLVSRDLGEPAP